MAYSSHAKVIELLDSSDNVSQGQAADGEMIKLFDSDNDSINVGTTPSLPRDDI